MSGEPVPAPRTEWFPHLLIFATGAAFFIFGARAFHVRGNFDWSDAVACALALIPAGLFLLISGYVFQHAKLAILLPILFAVVSVRAYPAFGVALGLALGGIAATSLWKERKTSQERRIPPASPGETQS